MRTIALVFVWSMIAACASEATASPTCGRVNASGFPAVRKVLLAHEFSRTWLHQAEIKSVGRVTVGRRRYDVYWAMHVTPFGACHGTQIVFVLGDQRRYLGAYLVNEEPTGIEGRDVVFPVENGDRLHFDERGPPTHGVLDGEPVMLTRSGP
jgi:hypothetical protein